MRTYLSEFVLQRPEFVRDQATLSDWLTHIHAQAEELKRGHKDPEFEATLSKMIARFGCKPSQIGFRGTDVPDVQGKALNGEGLYSINSASRSARGADIEERNHFFDKKVSGYLENFYPATTTRPDHIVHVSCTGYVSPSPVQKFIAGGAWNEATAITHAYHMGCYASLPAVRMASGFLANQQGRIDILHSEMCTLHLNPTDHRPEQLVVQSLFGDGHIKYTATSEKPPSPGFEVLGIQEWIVPDSADAMTWFPTPWGMQMSLSRDVPEKIASRIKPFIEKILKSAGVGGVEKLSECAFGIHPGGPKIIDSLAALLELREDQIQHSRAVLHDYGNMSSATLPHVWSRIADDTSIAVGTAVISLAFGPGLTIFGSVMRKT